MSLKVSFEQFLAGVADDLAVLLVDAQEAALGIHVGDADGRVLERAAEPLLALAQRLLGPLALGDLPLQLFRATHRQGPGHDRHEGDNGSPGDDGRNQLDESSEAVGGPPEDDRFHQVRGAAGKNEGTEEPEDATEWSIPAPQGKEAEHTGDGEVRGPYPQVREDVQPAMNRGPHPTMPAWGKSDVSNSFVKKSTGTPLRGGGSRAGQWSDHKARFGCNRCTRTWHHRKRSPNKLDRLVGPRSMESPRAVVP